MTYAEAIDYLFTAMPSFQNIGAGAYKPGLERIESFCKLLGSPHLRYEIIHVAGTNGKGSVSHAMASVLQHEGRKVGLFTSPHLRDFRERIRVNGEMISQHEVVAFVERYRADMERIGLSFFEMTAALAFLHFAQNGVDIAVIETGLGGRLDATNIVTPRLSIITNIGLDHTAYLGTTLPEIAREKGGIIKPHTPVIVGERGAEYSSVIEDIARLQESPIIFAEDMSQVLSQSLNALGQSITLQDINEGQTVDIELDLAGLYQSKNIVTLYAATKQLGISNDVFVKALSSVVSTTSLVGRWQRLCDSPRVICDTGHNAHGIKYITEQLRATPHRRLIMVLGFANDKEVTKILPLFDPSAHFIFTQPRVSRAMACEDIVAIAKTLSLDYEVVEDVAQALARAKSIASEDDLIFVGGSNFVVAEVV